MSRQLAISGHIFFGERWYGFDDATHTAARLLEILSKAADPSAVLNALSTSFNTPEVNAPCAEGEHHAVIEKLRQTAKFGAVLTTIDGLRADYPDGFRLDVLSCFRGRDRSLGNQELAKRCGLPKSTISRLTYTLTKLGYLEHDGETGRYRLGSATLSVGSAMLSRMEVRQLARPLIQLRADETQTMVSLGARGRLSSLNCGGPALQLSREHLLERDRPPLMALVQALQKPMAPA